MSTAGVASADGGPSAKALAMQGVGSLQIMTHTIRIKEPPVYNGEMDYYLVESWIFNVDNYFALVGLTDPI